MDKIDLTRRQLDVLLMVKHGNVTYGHRGYCSGDGTVSLNWRESAAARHLLKTGAIEISADARSGEPFRDRDLSITDFGQSLLDADA